MTWAVCWDVSVPEQNYGGNIMSPAIRMHQQWRDIDIRTRLVLRYRAHHGGAVSLFNISRSYRLVNHTSIKFLRSNIVRNPRAWGVTHYRTLLCMDIFFRASMASIFRPPRASSSASSSYEKCMQRSSQYAICNPATRQLRKVPTARNRARHPSALQRFY